MAAAVIEPVANAAFAFTRDGETGEVAVAAMDAGVDDADLDPIQVGRTAVDDAVAVLIPHRACLKLVDVPGYDLFQHPVFWHRLDRGDRAGGSAAGQLLCGFGGERDEIGGDAIEVLAHFAAEPRELLACRGVAVASVAHVIELGTDRLAERGRLFRGLVLRFGLGRRRQERQRKEYSKGNHRAIHVCDSLAWTYSKPSMKRAPITSSCSVKLALAPCGSSALIVMR